MSIEYLIGPLDQQPPNFDLKVENLKAEFLRQWPDAVINDDLDRASLGFSWRVTLEDYIVPGEYSDNQKIITIMASIPYAALFAVWYRQFVPSQERIQIVDFLGNHRPFEIEPQTAEGEIVDAFT